MNSKSLIACMAILGCVSVTSLSVQAATASDQSEPKVAESKDNMHELELGSRAPQQFQRPEAGLKDWKKRGLTEPKEQAQWVKINDKYVLVQITNGQITEIVPVKK